MLRVFTGESVYQGSLADSQARSCAVHIFIISQGKKWPGRWHSADDTKESKDKDHLRRSADGPSMSQWVSNQNDRLNATGINVEWCTRGKDE